MNATMVREFCTLEEAAERLHTSQAQIERLIDKGLLREFRDGTHRLLRAADVGAILAARNRQLERQSQSTTTATSQPGAKRRKLDLADDPELGTHPHTEQEDTAARESARRNKGPRNARNVRRPQNTDLRPARARRSPTRPSSRARSSNGPRRPQRQTQSETPLVRQSLSVREWFWTGLLQDRPIAIALLSGLILLGLSAAVAGLCMLTGMR